MKRPLRVLLSAILVTAMIAGCTDTGTGTTETTTTAAATTTAAETDAPTEDVTDEETDAPTEEETEAPTDEETEETTEEATETPTETDEPQASLSGELMIGLPGAYEVTNETVVQNFIDMHPDLDVTVDSGPWGDYVTKINTQLAAGIAPDVWFQENAVILGNGAKGAAEDLASLIEADLDTDLYANSLFAAQSGDNIWGVPHDVNNIALAYNKDLFDAADLDYPDDSWSYQDMYDAAVALTDGDNPSDKTYGYLYQGSITTGWFPFGKAYGGMILNDDKTEAVLDDAYWQGIEFAAQFVSEGLSPDSTLMGELGGPRVLFGNDRAGMMYVQFSVVRLLNEEFPDLNWDVSMIPMDFNGDRIVPTVTNSWMIYSRADQENKDNAWAFLQHYLGEESQDIIAAAATSIPDLISSQQVLLDAVESPDLSAYTDGLEFAVTLDENPSWNAWRGAVQTPSLDLTNGLVELDEDLKADTRQATQDAIDTWNEENILD